MEAFSLSIALLLAQDKHPWQDPGVGSWVERKTTVTAAGATTTTTERITLRKREDDDRVTLDIETTADGKKTAATKVETARPQQVVWNGVETGKKKVVIDGEEIECLVLEEEGFYGPSSFTQGKVNATRLVSTLSPARGVVEEKARYTQLEQLRRTTTFKLVRLKEKKKIGGRTVTCWAVESRDEEGDKVTEEKAWYSYEVPGHLVRLERTERSSRGARTTLVVATGFESK